MRVELLVFALHLALGMSYDSFRHHRRSIRMKGYDYASEGAYFVTICTQGRENLFCQIANGKMILNENGKIVNQTWNDLTVRFPNLQLDEFVIMPNHVHGIIGIVGAQFIAPENGNQLMGVTPKGAPVGVNHAPTVGQIIRYLKAKSAYLIHKKDPSCPVWQRNYFECIIRTEEELNRIRQYIIDNPNNWENDPENITGVE